MIIFIHVSLQDPGVEDTGKSVPVSSPSTSTGDSNQTHHNNASHSTAQSQFSDNDILSPSFILSTFQAASVSRTLTLHLYLAATDSNSSMQANPTLLDNHGQSSITALKTGQSSITALKTGLYTLPSTYASVGHVYLYPNSTLNNR